MKWGVRKSDGSAGSKEPKGELVLTKTFKTGDSLSIYKNPPPLIARWLSKVSPNYKTNAENFAAFSLRDKDGKKVGDAAFARKGDALDLNWIGVKPKHRGKGYASAAMNGVIKYAKKEGISKLTLEVPGKSPDARHIYEKLGFKMDGRDSLDKSSVDVWGGLYGMSYEVNKAKHEEDSSPEQWEEDFAQEFSQFLIDNFGTRGGEVEHKANFEDFLEHYGIPGMKWGVRKKQQVPASSDASRSLDIKAKAKTGKVKALTNAELRTAIERMNLEQQYKRLAVNDKPAVTRFISSTLLEIGKREVQAAAAKKVAAVVARKVATGGLG
jgi:GNAT superfamily N-acetyltransferase